MYTPKTKVSDANVEKYLQVLEDETKRDEAFLLLDLFTKITGEEAKLWWDSIVGFWIYAYETKSCKWEWMRTGFAARKAGFSIYIMPWYDMGMEGLLQDLGKHKMWKSCLTIKRLTDIDIRILEKIIKKWFEIMEQKYPRSI